MQLGDVRRIREGRYILFWVLGALLMLAGSWIAGHLEWTVGTTKAGYYGALIIAFLMFLVAGLCWIGVAVGASRYV